MLEAGVWYKNIRETCNFNMNNMANRISNIFDWNRSRSGFVRVHFLFHTEKQILQLQWLLNLTFNFLTLSVSWRYMLSWATSCYAHLTEWLGMIWVIDACLQYTVIPGSTKLFVTTWTGIVIVCPGEEEEVGSGKTPSKYWTIIEYL